MDISTPGTGGTTSTENTYVIKPTNLGEGVLPAGMPTPEFSVNQETTTPDGNVVTPPKNVGEDGLPTEPFEYVLPGGQPAGAKYSDPQYQVGTLDYTIRTKSEGYRNLNRWLFQSASDSVAAYDPKNPAGKLPDVASFEGVNKPFADFINNIRSILPEGKNTPDDAAWYILNVEQPRTSHDARYAFSKIRPLVSKLVDNGQNVYDLSDTQIIALAQQAGVDQSVVKRLAAEASEKQSRIKTDTYTMTKLRGMVDMLDPIARQGQLVMSDFEKHLFDKEGIAKRDAFLAFTRWKERHGEGFLKGMMNGIGHLAVEAGYGVGGIAEGAVGTLVSIGTGGQVLMENGRSVLSDTWIQKTQAERDEANRVLLKAHEYATKFGQDFVNASNDPGRQAAMVTSQFGQYADKDVVNTFRRLSELKNAGAYRSQMSWERLANFGEGVMEAVPNLVKFFTSSLDPNSLSFRIKADVITRGSPGGFNALGPFYEAWIKGSKTYKEMEGAELDENIRIFEENYRDVAIKTDPIVARMYDALAESTKKGYAFDFVSEAMGLGKMSDIYKAGANAARGQLQETRLIEAGGLADPITMTIGATKLLGIGAKAGEGMAIAQKYAAEMKAISADAIAAQTAAGTTSAAFDTAVATLKAQLEKSFPGAKITNDDVIAIAMTAERRGLIGESAAAKLIRKKIGKTIAQNENLATRAQKIQAELDAIPDKATGVAPASINATRARLAAGAMVKGAGYATEATGGSLNWIGDWIENARSGGPIEGNVFKRGLHSTVGFLMKQPMMTGVGSAITSLGVAGFVAQGDLFTAVMAGTVGISAPQLFRPEFLKFMGTNVAQIGRIQRALGATTTEGSRYGGSMFIQSAIDLENQAVKLSAAAAAGDEAAKVKMAELVGDAQKLRSWQKTGLEEMVRSSSRIVFEDGVVGGGVGAMLAYMNDTDAAGAGAGMGIGFSLGLRAAHRLYSATPHGAQPVLDKVVLADLATMLEMPAERGGIDPSSRAMVFRYLEESNAKHPNDPEAASREYISRAQIIRDLVITHRGDVGFVNGAEFEAALILTSSPADEATLLMKEAAKAFPADADGAKRQAYIERRQEQLKASRQARDLATSLSNDIAIQEQKLNKRNDEIAKSKIEVAKLEAEVKRLDEQAKFGDFGSFDPKQVEEAHTKLERALENQSRLEAEASLLNTELGQLRTSRNKAQADAGTPTPLRPYESRPTVNGERARKVSNAIYIVDGAQGRRTYIDLQNVDKLGAISEGWHALLQDAAVQDLLPDMVLMMFGTEGDLSGGARKVAFNSETTEALIRAYAADLPPAQRDLFLQQYEAGKSLAMSSGGKDVSGLYGVTEEILTWFMATIDQNKRTAYRPGLATPEGAAASSAYKPGEGRKPGEPIGWSDVRKLLFGDRQISDEVSRAARTMFDPDSGIFVRRSAEHMKSQLERAGMRFIEGGDGTFRGYFINNKNEIIRNPVLNEFYDRVIAMTGGKQSRRIRPANFYDTLVPIEQRIDMIKARGMDWMLTPDGKDILPPDKVAAVSDAFTRDIANTLAALPEHQRGMLIYNDPKNPTNTTFSGVPSDAEIAAVANNQNIPKTIKDNLLMIMQSMAAGESTATIIGEYTNLFSVNKDTLTEARLRVGKDIDGKTALRRGNPMMIKIEDSPVYGKDGKIIRVDDPSKPGAKMNLTQKVIKVQMFGMDEFVRSTNRFFEEGMWYRDKDGNKIEMVKDPKGNNYTPEYLNELFNGKAGFTDAATVYLNHLYKNGPMDPYSPTPTQVSGPSAEVLDPKNPERGAAMRDALRVLYGMESGKKRIPNIQSRGVETNAATGFAVRGDDFAIWESRLDMWGPMKATGESFFINQRSFTSGSFVMSPRDWESVVVPQVKGKSQMIISATTVDKNTRGKVEGINVEKVMSHPVLSEVKLFVGNLNGEKAYAYTMGDGNIRHITAKNQAEALEVVRSAIGAEIESTLWMREAMAGVVEQNKAANPTVTVPPTIPVAQKGKPAPEPVNITNINQAASSNRQKGNHQYVYVERAEAGSGIYTDGRMVLLKDALVDDAEARKPKALGTRTINEDTKKVTMEQVQTNQRSFAEERKGFVLVSDTTRIDHAVVRMNHSKSWMKTAYRDTGVTRLTSEEGKSAVFQSGALEKFTSLLDPNKVDLLFNPEQRALIAVKKGEKIAKDGSNILGITLGLSGEETGKTFKKLGALKPEAPAKAVLPTKAEAERLSVPFSELQIDRHGWSDDAMVTATGYNTKTDTPFETTQFGHNYQAHGMTKQIGPNTALKAVIKMFSDGIDPKKSFHTAPYRLPESTTTEERAGIGAGLGTGGGEAWKEGPITIVSKSGPRGQQINNIRDIGFVVVNDGAFKDPDAAVTILRERLPKSVQVIKMSEEAKYLVKHQEPGSFETPVKPVEAEPKSPVLMTMGEEMPAGANRSESARMNRERDNLLAAQRDEDPAAIEEERKRIQGERIKKQIEQILNQREAVAAAREKQLTAETAAEAAIQAKSDEGWAMYAAGHGEREAAKLKQFTKEQNAQIRQIWEAEENAISQVEKQREQQIIEAQRQAKLDARAAAQAQKSAEKLDAIITARRRALQESVNSVLNRQSKNKAARDAGMEKLVDEFFASKEPAVAPGLLRISSDQLLTTLHRIAYDPATGIAFSPYTGAPLVGMPAKPGVFSKPILTSRYTSADRPYPLLPDVNAPQAEWDRAYADLTLWRQQKQAQDQSKFEAAFPNRFRANPIAGRAYEGPMKAQGILNDIESKIWVTEGGVRLVREYKKADAASKGGVQYRVYGANGMQIYFGNSANDAREAGEKLDAQLRNAGIGVRANAGLPTDKVDKNVELARRAAEMAGALETEPADQRNRAGVNVKAAELERATKRYNR